MTNLQDKMAAKGLQRLNLQWHYVSQKMNFIMSTIYIKSFMFSHK